MSACAHVRVPGRLVDSVSHPPVSKSVMHLLDVLIECRLPMSKVCSSISGRMKAMPFKIDISHYLAQHLALLE